MPFWLLVVETVSQSIHKFNSQNAFSVSEAFAVFSCTVYSVNHQFKVNIIEYL